MATRISDNTWTAEEIDPLTGKTENIDVTLVAIQTRIDQAVTIELDKKLASGQRDRHFIVFVPEALDIEDRDFIELEVRPVVESTLLAAIYMGRVEEGGGRP